MQGGERVTRGSVRRRRRFLPFLAVMGPGLVTAFADNDACGIATYSTAGASYGYKLLWVIVVLIFVLVMVQEMCARMGAVTQKGLAELIREEFGVRWTLFALLVMLVANLGVTMANFAGVASSLGMFGAPRWITVPAATALIWLIVVLASYRRIERILIAMCVIFAAYIASAFLGRPDWGQVAHGLFVPSFTVDYRFTLLFVALVGTTITPWMQFFIQSTVVDKGISVREYRYEKIDVYVGAITADIIALFIIIATAATLYAGKLTDIVDARQVAEALRPVAGKLSAQLFAAGLLNASLMAGAILPLTTAYTFCEAFGWEMGLSKPFRGAPTFFGIFTVVLIAGAALSLIPGLNLMRVMVLSQDLNCILLPVVLVFMLKIINRRSVMGEMTNRRLYNIVSWATVAAIIALSLVLLTTSIAGT
jgi:NRAMP (natural resistance-associated macrophage protein)-like metal ion transporter